MIRDNILVFKNTDMPSTSNGGIKCNCDSNNLDYYREIEKFKSKLKDSNNVSSKLEMEIADIKERYKKDILRLNEEISRSKEKYERLHESHKRVSRLNHDLEERMLNLIEKFNNEKSQIDQNYKDILSKYESSQLFISELQSDCERYRNDCIIAVELLQNNPSSFLSRHIETVPIYLKNRLHQFQKNADMYHSFKKDKPVDMKFHNQNSSNSYIPITTFPPTAMYSDYPIDKKESLHPNHVCASVLAGLLHPDKVVHHQKNTPDTKCTIEVVCNKCGTVKEYRDMCVQTIPHSSENNFYQRNPRNNQNLIFDV